jgi:chitin synthase
MDNDVQEAGDIPLLRRDGSQGSMRAMPGAFDEPDERSETNIRYGRIPQRVPRRYKTIKKVE